MPNRIGVFDTEGDFPGWGEMAVIRGEMRGFAVVVEAEKHFHEYFEDQLRNLIFRLRYRSSFFDDPDGLTWAEIGEALGTSRQAAQQRFGTWVELRRREIIDEYDEAFQEQVEDGE